MCTYIVKCWTIISGSYILPFVHKGLDASIFMNIDQYMYVYTKYVLKYFDVSKHIHMCINLTF